MAEAKEVVSGTARDRQLSKRELDKLDKALFSAVAQNISGKAQHLFQVLVDLRATRELAEGRLVPGPGAMLITGVDEYLQELVEEAYRLLGIPARA